MAKYAMVIDLQRCTGCGGCILACKNENNLSEGVSWSSKIAWTEGTFPDVRYTYITTLCNHCENAPCVKGCPTSAMHKTEDGVTNHDPDKCIGCRYCMTGCPYGVINFNWEDAHAGWQEQEALIADVTAAPAEMVQQVGGTSIPYYNPALEETYEGVRPRGVVEKCNFCNHRLENGQLPYCVESCPSNARAFGDLDDPNSDVSKLLAKFRSFRLREHLGTEPKVFYVREFTPGTNVASKGGV
ncbi:MAG: 4Fe-4S dicluster domain-containing protein [Anaerolineales bacterium]|nr:4Fe-4S dicluster domain-containing protein [Chloroflexota bacterium]MBL6983036.1 4Fe-4S dicluster domain-containing protein [Anaerolineales bacterium]